VGGKPNANPFGGALRAEVESESDSAKFPTQLTESWAKYGGK